MKGKDVALIAGGLVAAYMLMPQVRDQVDSFIPIPIGGGGDGLTILGDGLAAGGDLMGGLFGLADMIAGGFQDMGSALGGIGGMAGDGGLFGGGGFGWSQGGGFGWPQGGGFGWPQGGIMGFPGVTPVSDESIGETIVKKMVENTPDFAYTAASLAALGLTGYAAVKTAPAVVGGVKGATSRLIPKRTAKKTATRAATRFIPGTTTKAVAGTAERLAARAAPRVAERQFFQQSAQRAASTVTRAAPKVLHPEMGARITEMMGKKTTARTAQRVGGRALLKNLGGRVATRAIPGIGTALLVADVGATIYEGITRRDVGGQYLGFGDVLGFTQKPGISRKAEGAFARAGISQDQYKKLLSRGMSPAQINQLIAKQRGA